MVISGYLTLFWVLSHPLNNSPCGLVSLKHDGTDGPDGPVKMANLPVLSVSDRQDRLSRLSVTDGTGKTAAET